jgi:hypothetical protein
MGVREGSMQKVNLPGTDDRMSRVSDLLRVAAGQMAEAYALLRQSSTTAEALRWDNAFSWHLEELQKAIDICGHIEQCLTSGEHPR